MLTPDNPFYCEGEYEALKRFFGGLTLRNASDRSRFFRLADL
jgi:hypothetical protein